MTIAYNALGTLNGQVERNDTYIVATANDTTATVFGKPIPNDGGQIDFIAGWVSATNQTGTSPTLTLNLQGSNDGATWTDLVDSAGNSITTTALSISTASTTNVGIGVDTVMKPRTSFPAFLRWKIAVGGSGTPGGTYTVATQIQRAKWTKSF